MKMKTISNNVPSIQHKRETNEQESHLKQIEQVQKQTVETHREKEINKEDIQSTVEKMNEFIDPLRTNLKFVMHEELHEYYVTVIDPLTDEVLKEIPPKKLLDMYAAMAEYMGLLVDEKI